MTATLTPPSPASLSPTSATSDSESWNSWTKRTLPNKRAAALRVQDQVLDYLATAALRNITTWASHEAGRQA